MEVFCILILDIADLFFSDTEYLRLLFRYNHVVDADRNTSPGCISEAHVHELVSKYDSCFQANFTVTGIDKAGNRPLAKVAVDVIETHTLWQNL